MLVLDRVLLFHPYFIFISYSLYFWKKAKNLKIPVFSIFFVNDGLFVSQNKSLTVLNSHLFYSYYIMSFILSQLRLIIEHGKTEVFHFSRLHELFHSLSLDLTIPSSPIFWPKETWCYLRFIFDRKLTFKQHINFYVNKVLSTINYMKMLGNSSRGLIPT